MKPPYTVNSRIVTLVSEITNLLGQLSGLVPLNTKPSLELRRKNRAISIQSSLAIEGNSLSLDQVSDIIKGKKILAKEQEIIEIQNAIQAYDQISQLESVSEKSLLKAHKLLMQSLVPDAGKYRCGNVGIFKGKQVAHVAPQAKMLPKLMSDLFCYLKHNEDHLLIKSCVFHYEFEFIHPFSDGNGRLGRLWQSLILTEFDSVFEYLPIESLIKAQQKQYYQVLGSCDKAGDSTTFIEFILAIIKETLENYSSEYTVPEIKFEDRIQYARQVLRTKEFNRKEYINLQKSISSATASRDLVQAVKLKLIKKHGEKNQTKYKFN